jgi:hypothetical protein
MISDNHPVNFTDPKGLNKVKWDNAAFTFFEKLPEYAKGGGKYASSLGILSDVAKGATEITQGNTAKGLYELFKGITKLGGKALVMEKVIRKTAGAAIDKVFAAADFGWNAYDNIKEYGMGDIGRSFVKAPQNIMWACKTPGTWTDVGIDASSIILATSVETLIPFVDIDPKQLPDMATKLGNTNDKGHILTTGSTGRTTQYLDGTIR